MRLDAKLLFSNNQAIAAGTVISETVLKVGSAAMANPLLIDVKLTTGLTGGTVTKVKLQSASDAAFTTPVDEVEITVPTSIVQTRACTLASFFSPIKLGNDYARLIYTAGAGASGGKVFAGYSDGAQIR
ncbi:MAG: hypothetical protein AB9883_07810 [Acidaminococcaceae bacterium]